MTEQPLKPSAQRVQDHLTGLGYDCRVTSFSESTRTSEEAAAAIGCTVGQIAKSLIFRGKQSGKAVLAIACGDRRVDEKKLAALIGEKVGRADPEFVREATGFAIGGVPPVGHSSPSITLLDEGLWRFERIWAAAGTPNSVFETTPDDLAAMTEGLRGDLQKT
ncbi:YbaK/EbsC family protein [Limibacillus sp. MBR-115]|jgi:prolyl-tRNA editing enzyme YbaK/EbsC (Cys-tRNA(Pro) deacylase)|uniref:YbaK/EbsC family protein n=1 Tax=Limibacillus sp. MBR-115 TaxID=3156465 RepID=UPI00339622F2